MNYTHIEDKPPVPTEKDFLVEIAKSVETLQNCGLKITSLKLEFVLSEIEFYKAFTHFSSKTITLNGKPTKDFKVNFSGVDVKFIKGIL